MKVSPQNVLKINKIRWLVRIYTNPEKLNKTSKL